MGRKLWYSVEQAWDQFSHREKALSLVTACVFPLALLFVSVVEPALNRLKETKVEVSSLERTLQTQQQVFSLLKETELSDPNITARKELHEQKKRLDAISGDVDKLARSLVGPEEMLELLHSVLGPEYGLKLIEASSLPVVPLIEDELKVSQATDQVVSGSEAASPNSRPEAAIYKHPFDLKLEGSYEALYRYLKDLESLHQGFFWERLQFTTQAYPKAIIHVRVYTLSTEENWLGA